ncbi:MAG: hypothetical protein PQJ58_15825 [Spirochaetales bacterium]|nr:hypothetical protein [Spirochaetales bacterium]
MQTIPENEIQVLRSLAARLAELSKRDKNKANAEAWKDLNALKPGSKPMVLVHLWETAWGELLPKEETFQCRSERGFFYENQLRRKLWMAANITDDGVEEPVIQYPTGADLSPYGGLDWRIEYAEGEDSTSGAYHYIPVLNEKKDIEKLQDPILQYDSSLAAAYKKEAEEIFDGLLDCVPETQAFAGKVTDEYSWLRGLDKIYFDLIDDPEWTHEVLQRICDNYIMRFKMLEEAGLWGRWEKSDPLGSTGLRYCHDMDDYPATMEKGSLKLSDTWAFFTAEAFNNISPDMHYDFAYTYDRQMAPLFKYINVGCCEDLTHKIEGIRTIPNVRRISVSEWADVKVAAEAIGNDYVYGYKPSGVPFVMNWSDEEVRKELRTVLDCTSDSSVELILNIGGTTGKNGEENLKQWTRIANEEVDRYMSKN